MYDFVKNKNEITKKKTKEMKKSQGSYLQGKRQRCARAHTERYLYFSAKRRDQLHTDERQRQQCEGKAPGPHVSVVCPWITSNTTNQESKTAVAQAHGGRGRRCLH